MREFACRAARTTGGEPRTAVALPHLRSSVAAAADVRAPALRRAASPAGISTRISDACELLGAAHLDAFFAEYVCPDEHLQDVRDALLAASSDPRVRAVGASTHSVSAASALLDLHEAEDDPLLDAIMLRVGMAHQVHETASTLERAAALGVPVVGFCSTRWNGLLEEAPELGLGAPPSAAECVGWSLGSQGVEYVVHSSRNQRELTDVLVPAAALADTLCGGSGERERWSRYGDAWCEARGTSDGFEADAA